MPHLNPEWTATALVVAMFAGVLMGLAKGGLIGLGALSTPILALVVDPVRAAGVLLPVLIAQDIVSVWAYRRDWDKRMVGWMLPGAMVGIGIGWMAAKNLPTSLILAMLGAVSVTFALWKLLTLRRAVEENPRFLPDWLAPLFGCVSGLTSQIAHAGAPPFQIWATHRRLAPITYAGTSSIYFATMNWMKVPAYAALGQLKLENLLVAAIIIPIGTLGSMAGIWIVRRIDMARFQLFTNAMLLLVGANLLYEGLR